MIMHSFLAIILGIFVISFKCYAKTQDSNVIQVNWGSTLKVASTAPSILVAADPEWLPGAKMYDAAIEGVTKLAELGADNIRLLNFNIFPGISCPQLKQGVWNFSATDLVMNTFMKACGNKTVIVDIETSPVWMWADASSNTTTTCADANSTSLHVGERTRCPNYGSGHVPVDRTWSQIAHYFKNVADWYTSGGFVDPVTNKRYDSNYNYKLGYWEILNEPDLTREHGLLPQQVIDYYDAMVREFNGTRPGGAKFMGPSFSGMSSIARVQEWVVPFLNKSNHHPSDTPLDALSFHIYAMCHNNTPAGMEQVFPTTDTKLSGLMAIDQARQQLRPDVELHLTESGLFCNEQPGKCHGQNDYPCWYRTFDSLFWVASAGQWLYQYLTYAQAVNITTIAQSQILGYPYQYDGLSGEWASGSMVDWTGVPGLNAKYYVMAMLLETVARPFSYIQMNGGESNDLVYVQALTSAKGKVVVIINKKSAPQSIHLVGGKGATSLWIEEQNWKAPAIEKKLDSEVIPLSPFAVGIVMMT
eukprot:m.37850 g.37850  ORF g.37850 m.37850 type:complete len:530 (-) comp9361_c0_seq1:3-1592(-)